MSDAERAMQARQVVPILNVSNLSDSFTWFAKLGWAKSWDWCPPGGVPSFGAVVSGNFEMFLCLDGQGGRGRDGGVGGEGQGVWISIWVDAVDAVHAVCVREELEVLQPPRDEPWGVREMHVRHPDGHVFRVSQSGQPHEHEHPHPHPHEHEDDHSDDHAHPHEHDHPHDHAH